MGNDSSDLWPSFVDVMSNMFIMLLFVAIALLTLGQPSGNSENPAENESLRLSIKLEGAIAAAKKERIKAAAANGKISELNALVFELEGDIIKKENRIRALAANEENYQSQIARLSGEMAKLNEVFDMTDKYIKWQRVQIVELGKKLNRALANRTAELVKVRSDFFASLLGALDGNRDFEIVGDRFAMPSEVLFPPNGADVSPAGRAELAKIAAKLKDAMRHFPGEADWVLRVDGHTDSRPVPPGSRHRDNWELSSARAMAVVAALIEEGVPAGRLAAAGFGQYRPVSPSHAKNRRIEFKLTEK